MAKTGKQVISGYHRPVCVKCNCELHPEKNGAGLLDMLNPTDKSEPQPYQLWDADLWKCPKCGMQVVGGFAQGPIANHHETNFKQTIANYRSNSQVIVNYG